MKQCPQCRQTYSDETLFCLSDGTPLAFANDAPEELTVVNPLREEVTVVRPAQNIPPPIQTAPTGVNPIFAYLAGGLFLLLLVVGVVGIGLFAWNRTSKPDIPNTPTPNSNLNNNGQNNLEKDLANLQAQKDQIEREKQRLENERKKLDEEKNKRTETPLPTPPSSTPLPTPPSTTPYPAQPTARIKFGRGRVAESVSGKIYSRRSFVLEARSGQYLSASVGSGGGCVAFSGGGTSTGFVTNSGDNRLTLVNNCNSEAGFTLTVSIR